MSSKPESLTERESKLSDAKRALLERWKRSGPGTPKPQGAIPKREATARVPLSFAQERLWFLDQFEPNSPSYNIPAVVRLRGKVDPVALEQSLNTIIERHESLRTVFQETDGIPFQVIAQAKRQLLEVTDLSGITGDEQSPELQRQIALEVNAPFDLVTGPLVRMKLLVVAEDDCILLLTLHHIISDAWSTGVLISELASFYEATVSGKPTPVQPLPIQYGDYALWQRQWLTGSEFEAQLAYWKKQLDGPPPVLELPTDRPRPAARSYSGKTITHSLPTKLIPGLDALCQRTGCTRYMVLLAIFDVLLYRYSGQTDFCVGSPVTNRARTETEGLIGFFVNTLVMRSQLDGTLPFLKLLEQVRETALGAFSHQDVPFERLVEELHPVRDMSRTPLFQVMFALQNAPVPKLELSNLSLSPVDVPGETARFDMILFAREQAGKLVLMLEYVTDLFDEATMHRLLGHFHTLLDDALNRPEASLDELQLVTPAEYQQLVYDWNDTVGPFPDQVLMHEWFEAQVTRTPDATAVVFADQSLTYTELNAAANRLARHLHALGVTSGELVGIAVERSLEMIVGLLGITKAGGAYVPLESSFPAARIEWIVQTLRLRCLVTQTSRTDLESSLVKLPDLREIVCLPDCVAGKPETTPAVGPHQRWWAPGDWDDLSPENLPRQTSLEDIAYIIFTSGSTGTPKGVVVTHRPVSNLIDWFNTKFQLGPQDRVLFITSLGFDLSVYDVFGVLAAGGSIRVASRSDIQNPETLVRVLIEDGITFWDSAPSALQQLVSFFPSEPTSETNRLRLVYLSGDWIPVPLPDAVRKVFPKANVIALGGATEATVWSNYYPVTTVDPTWPSIPYGKPMRNAQYYVLDGQLQPCPVGIPGDLYISGDCLSLGYIGESRLTAEKYLPHPLSGIPGDRIYKTGDRARFKADGNIEFLGRIDQQVKIRGYRIELGEIEVALNQHPGIRDAVVIAREDEPRLKRLVAYVIPQAGQSPGVSELRSFLKERLPEYMTPSAFVTLQSFPVTSNGKLDRKALPAPDGLRPDLEKPYVAPRTELEAHIAGIWAQMLKVERVGAEDNFFELGGHSLLATRVVSSLRTSFQIELPLRSLFEAPTPATLAQKISTLVTPERRQVLPAIEPVDTPSPAPLSFVQERMWFFTQLDPNSYLYNLSFAIRLTGHLREDLLEQSFIEVISRHAALRTRFPAADGKAVQTVLDVVEFRLPVTDLTSEPAPQREPLAQKLAEAEATHCFDLSSEQLIRARLVRLTATEHILVGTLHHIVADGWSIGVLVREIAALYDALVTSKPHTLAPLAIQYTDYAHWQRTYVQGDVLEQQLTYWEQQLGDDLAVLELPTDRPRPAVQSFHGATIRSVLPKALNDDLNRLSRGAGATLFMTLLAGFQTLLYRYTGQTDIAVGTPIANRNQGETEDLIGCFVNTLVLRTRLSSQWKVSDLLGSVRETALGAYAHQDAPFEMVVERLSPQRDLGHTPLFQVMFTLENAPMPPLQLTGLTLEPLEAPSTKAMFDLTLSMAELPEGLAAAVEYNTDLFDASTIDQMLVHFETLLTAMVQNPDQFLSELPLMTQSERHQVLVEWNETTTHFETAAGLHSLFEAQVERTPHRIAVDFEGTQVTYAELNQRANQLAHFLLGSGVGPEKIVGICVERSVEMLVGLLGILKAGAAYLPLDPEYPTDRLAFLISDARPTAILTQAHIAKNLPVNKAELIYLDTDRNEIQRSLITNPVSGVTSENPAYVIYTSGSTGQPKGVVCLHGSVCNHMLWLQKDLPFTESDRVVQKYSFSFDASLCELFAPLIVGARLVIARPGGQLDGDYLASLLVDQKITVIDLVPSLLEALLDDPKVVAGNTLRRVQCGGEALPATVLERVFGTTRAEVFNLYGPTEATIGATFHRCEPAQPTGVIPIGRPIANTQAYVLDRSWEPVPAGVPGELFLGGAGIARGYLNHPGRTAENFIPDSLSGVPGARLYATGDRVRRRTDGTLEFLGRMDEQVKIRGFRIEPGEVEAVLKRHPDVREAVVLARPLNEASPAANARRLVAYVTRKADVSGFQPPLVEFLKAQLPDYMVPSVFVELDAFPLTRSGKIDRRALPIPERTATSSKSPELPQTEVEHILSQIWSEVLGIKTIGVNDNFFDLGGDSILSIQIVARANRAGVRMTPKQLFQHPTIAGLAAVAGSTQVLTAEQGEVSGHLPLTPIQQWFLEQNFAERHRWNQSVLFEARTPVSIANLTQAVQMLVTHHDALRLRFARTTAGWRQFHASPSECESLIHLDFSAVAEGDWPETIVKATEMLQNSLDLATGPVFQVGLMTFGDDIPARLFLVAHHLVVDAVSWRILLEDFQAILEQLEQGPSPVLPAKTTSFKHWAHYLQTVAQGDALKREIGYWTTPVRERISKLPVDVEAGADTEASAETVTLSLTTEETRALLHDVPSVYHTQVNDILVTALAMTLGHWTGTSTHLVDLEGHGRDGIGDAPDVSRTVGWFTTVFPVLLEVNRQTQPGEAIKSVKDQLRQIPNKGTGHGLLRYLSPEAETRARLAALPQAEVLFNYLGQFDQVLAADSRFVPAQEPKASDHSPLAARSHTFEINAHVGENRLQVNWAFSRNRHRRATVETLCGNYVEALRALIRHCLTPDAGGFTPSDFPGAKISQKDLDTLMLSLSRKKGFKK